MGVIAFSAPVFHPLGGANRIMATSRRTSNTIFAFSSGLYFFRLLTILHFILVSKICVQPYGYILEATPENARPPALCPDNPGSGTLIFTIPQNNSFDLSAPLSNANELIFAGGKD
ncbi:MAG: hypothetical protein KBA08_06500 [Firmicutes bacterium]|nr:hypothetical protein [Bacillota bacterium]